jgi:predicted nucleic acid-binding protein
LADAFAAATAEENGCALITTDRNDFAEVEQAGALQIIWLR